MLRKSVMLMLVLVLLMSAFVGVNAAKKIKAVYAPMDLSSPYWVEISNGMKAAGKKLGWDVQIYDPKGEVQNQVAALENYIAQKVDLIYLSSLNANALAPIVKKAMAKGIPVITEATIVEGTAAHVGPGEVNMGQTLGEAIGQWCKANLKGKIKAATYHVIQDPNTLVREKAMRDGLLKYYSDVEFVASLPGVNPDDGMKNMEGLLQSNRDINVVMGCNDDSVMASYQIAKSAGLDLNKLAFGGVNAVPQALDLMKKEKAAGKGAYRVSVDITPFATGELCIDVGKRVLAGEKFTETVVVQAKAVTWANIDEYFKK